MSFAHRSRDLLWRLGVRPALAHASRPVRATLEAPELLQRILEFLPIDDVCGPGALLVGLQLSLTGGRVAVLQIVPCFRSLARGTALLAVGHACCCAPTCRLHRALSRPLGSCLCSLILWVIRAVS